MAQITDPENTIIMTLKDGEVVIELLKDVAPKHAERMKQLARDKAYANVAFHRVIQGFMAQTGDVEYAEFGLRLEPRPRRHRRLEIPRPAGRILQAAA